METHYQENSKQIITIMKKKIVTIVFGKARKSQYAGIKEMDYLRWNKGKWKKTTILSGLIRNKPY